MKPSDLIDKELDTAAACAAYLIEAAGADPRDRRLAKAYQFLVFEPAIRRIAHRLAEMIHAAPSMTVTAIAQAAAEIADEELPPISALARTAGSVHPLLGSATELRKLVESLYGDGDFHAEACGIASWLAVGVLGRAPDPVVSKVLSPQRLEAWAATAAGRCA